MTDYDHAYSHALDFVLFDIAPWFDCRMVGWKMLPDDLREAVKKEQSRRAKLDGRGPRAGARNKGSKRGPIPEHQREAIRKSNRQRLTGKKKSPEHNAKNSAGVKAAWTPERREAQRQRMLGNKISPKKHHD